MDNVLFCLIGQHGNVTDRAGLRGLRASRRLHSHYELVTSYLNSTKDRYGGSQSYLIGIKA